MNTDFVNLTKDKNLDIRFIELMPIGAREAAMAFRQTK